MTTDTSGRVALVTGAGRGLGRSHALALAARGYGVVVNDSGAELDGTGGDAGVAQAVVDEIVAAGGAAVASTADISSSAGAAAAVQTALDEYGRLDAVVNNAGILRDRTFPKGTDEDFDAVVRTHLGGAAYTTRAAWAALRESGTGRVVLTSSASGLYGQFGQTNYAAAKAGLVGFMNALKLEGARSGITVNTIAPVARTRMTVPLLPADVAAGLDPEKISPVVAYLVSPQCTHTGLVLEVGAGLVAAVRIVESPTLPLSGLDDDAVGDAIGKLLGSGLGEPYPSSDDALTRVLDEASARAQ